MTHLQGKDKAVDVEFVRGVAALGVVVYHFARAFLPPEGDGGFGSVWGISAEPPFLFALVNGPFMVAVFFVLSSYVLSVKLVRENNWTRGIMPIAKRFPRLIVLTLVGTLLPGALYVLGLMANVDVGVITGSDWVGWSGGIKESPDLPAVSMWGAVADAFILYDRGYSQYNSALWTLRYELIGSCSALAVAALIGATRRPVLDALLVAVLGAVLLKIHPLVSICVGTVYVTKYMAVRPLGFPAWSSVLLIVGGLVLGSTYKAIPDAYLTSEWIAAQAERLDWLVHGAGAVFVFLGCRFLGSAVFEKVPLSRTLGRLSFPFYVLHIPLQASIASLIVVEMGYGWQSLLLGFVASSAALVVLAVLVARLDEWWVRVLGSGARSAQSAVASYFRAGRPLPVTAHGRPRSRD